MIDRPSQASAAADHILECHGCGLRHQMAPRSRRALTACRRCGTTLRRAPANSLDRSLALTVAGCILLVVACTFPFMSLSIEGRVQEANLITGVVSLARQDLWSLAVVVFLASIAAPAAKLGGTLYVLAGIRLRRPPGNLPLVFRWLQSLHPWAMVEVYLLGVFVAYVKLIDLASIGLGPAFFALATLMVVMVAIDASLSAHLVWEEMERRHIVTVPQGDAVGPLVLCETCHLTAPQAFGSRCPRCGARQHVRRPDSITRSWALVVAAAILYVPANFFPAMTVISFGKGAPDTILSGTVELFLAGMWPLALLVFFASITVPVLKLTGLVFLLVMTQRGSRWRLRDRTLLYRIVETVGRWSMIDIFMLSILTGLVQLGSLATIRPGVGAIAFASVVIITMFAARTFDPRLMWDAAGENR